MRRKERAREVAERLAVTIPEPRCELDHRNPWELLIATILSAQSTDRRVNSVTPELFKRWPKPAALADAPVEEVEDVIRVVGTFRNKAKAIRGASKAIVEEHGGEVPRTMSALTALPGVGRKTAGVVLGTAYGIAEGFPVDTHAFRVAHRLTLSKGKTPDHVEQDMMRLYPRDEWVPTHHRFVLFGRYHCTARKPDCAGCPLNELCPSRNVEVEGDWAERAVAARANFPDA